MNNTTKRAILVIACSMGAGLTQSSVAADATANVSVDWSQLQISVTGVDGAVPNVTFSDQHTSLNSSAYVPNQGSEYNSKSVYDWTSAITANSEATTSTFANASASPPGLSVDAQTVEDDSGYPYWDNPNASASGYRSEQFSFDGPGVLTVTVPYTLNITGGDVYDYYDSASASINASASFYGSGDNGSSSSYSNASFVLNSYYGESPQSQSGNLIFGIFAAGPGTGYLNFDMNASVGGVSMIPEPESYAMLLAGLGLISMVARRRSRTANTSVS